MKTIESKTASTHYRSPVQPFFSKQGENHSEAEASFFSPIPVQTKLEIGQPNDIYEQEADAMADRVVRGEASQLMGTDASSNVQMKCAACEKEQDVQRITSAKEPQGDIQTKPLLMRKAQNEASVGTPALVSQLSSKGGGQAMPDNTNQQMSQSFDTDFSGVRIHNDRQASEMNQELSARAFTHGSDIYFNQGEYSPGSSGGKRLLAHELTHVVQQTQNHQVSPIIQRNPLVLGGAAILGFLAGFGGAFVVDYLSMTRDRSLRFAQSMGTGWLGLLPNCPCTKPDRDPFNWTQDTNPDLSTYHPGAAFSYRSTPAATPGIRHGQQCTYDSSGRLIKTGAGAGTPDYYSPSTWYNIPYHIVYDVKTWKELGSSTYNRYWIPNQGVNCGTNDSE